MVFVRLRDWTQRDCFTGVDSSGREVRLDLIPKPERAAQRFAKITVTPQDRAKASTKGTLAAILAEKFIKEVNKDRGNYYAVIGDYKADFDSNGKLMVLFIPYSLFRMKSP